MPVNFIRKHWITVASVLLVVLLGGIGLVLRQNSLKGQKSEQVLNELEARAAERSGQGQAEEGNDSSSKTSPSDPTGGARGGAVGESMKDGDTYIICAHPSDTSCTDQPPPARPLLADKRIEVVDWEELLEWWPYRPLLRSSNPPVSRFDEDFHAWSEKGGRKADPSSEFAAASIWYRRPSSSPSSLSLSELLDAGALEVLSTFYPPGVEVAWQGSTVGETKAVVARNRAARMTTLRRGENANVDWRAIRWEETVDNGIIQWVFSSSPAVYSEEEVLRFVNELNETG